MSEDRAEVSLREHLKALAFRIFAHTHLWARHLRPSPWPGGSSYQFTERLCSGRPTKIAIWSMTGPLLSCDPGGSARAASLD